jgi:hypothetical protein
LETLATQIEAESLADEALNEAVRHIQDRLGVETGDFAAQFFSGEFEDVIKRVLVKYIEQEQEQMMDDMETLDEYIDDTTMTDESFGGAMTSFKP